MLRMVRKPADTEWAANIDRLLAAKGWNQKQLAAAADLNDNQVSRLIKRVGNPEIRQLRAVAKAFDVPLWHLFVPADLAERLVQGVELGTPLTPTGDQLNAPEETQSPPDESPLDDFTIEIFRAALTVPELRAAIRRAVSHFATARITDDRADSARDIVKRAVQRSKAPADGSPSTSPPDRPGGRGSGDR